MWARAGRMRVQWVQWVVWVVWVWCAAGAGARLRCPPPPAACHEESSAGDEYFFTIQGTAMKIDHTEEYFSLRCGDAVTLDGDSLPRLERLTVVPYVALDACPPPAAGYARALAALNVSVGRELELAGVPPAPALSAAHFAGLGALGALRVTAASPAALRPAPAFLEPLAGLRELALEGVRLAAGDAARLPPGLRALSLAGAGLAAPPPGTLERLPRLESLSLVDPELREPPDLSGAGALRSLFLSGPVARVPLAPGLESATAWGAASAELAGPCGGLRSLALSNAGGPLPAGWLAGCGGLERLLLERPAAGALAAGGAALRGAGALRELRVRLAAEGGALPAGLLAHAPRLRLLEVSQSGLTALPDGFFNATPELEALDLSVNELTAEGFRPLRALSSLRNLTLDDNPLGDLCGSGRDIIPNGQSVLHKLDGLVELRLERTHASRLCPDWRAMPLAHLALRGNRIAELQRDDLNWTSAARTEVDLRGNPLGAVTYSAADYEAALLASEAPQTVRVLLDGELACDCGAYWAARALRDRPRHVAAAASLAAAPLACRPADVRAGGAGAAATLAAVPLDLLRCALPPEHCAAGCRCSVRGDGAVDAHCAAAGLTAVPRPALPPEARLRRLDVSRNDIAAVDAADFPASLEEVDLSRNRIASASAEAATALLSGARVVRFANNSLRCACADRAFLAALLAHRAQVEDFAGVRCADGRAAAELTAAAGELCGAGAGAGAGPWAWGAAAAALGAACAAAAAAASRPAARHRLKRFLFERGLCLRYLLRPFTEEDDGRPYDAFVSFSHLDGEFVRALTERLERDAYRLCLHERDWTPGEWIPAQIAASVRRSRRTLVVLSEHFLRSQWARAEFREAYAAALRDERPRLVVLLLAEPPWPRLDPELAAYLRNNTYLRWGDPWFWEKLAYALPRRRPPAPPAPPAPTAAPAPPADVTVEAAGDQLTSPSA